MKSKTDVTRAVDALGVMTAAAQAATKSMERALAEADRLKVEMERIQRERKDKLHNQR